MPGPGSVHMADVETIDLVSSDPEEEEEPQEDDDVVCDDKQAAAGASGGSGGQDEDEDASEPSGASYEFEDDNDGCSSGDAGMMDEGVVEQGRAGSSAERRKPYRIIDAELLKTVQAEAVAEVAAIWACKKSVAKTLLMSYMWDKEKLLGDFAERGCEWVFKAAGVAQPSDSAELAPLDPASVLSCDVCMSELPASSCARNGCGHVFCKGCWLGHLEAQIGDGKARHVTCMAFKCGVVCDEELVLDVVKSEPALLAKYQKSHLDSYMEDNQRVAFCPSAPWCGHAIEVDADPYVEPECVCGTAFCFKCKKAPHSPCTCAMWGMWDEKINGDSETRNWLAANTKPCPKCTKPVEKNGGCNLVVCKCGQPFCWLCGSATGMQHTWTEIANHSCGRYKDEADAKVNEALRSHKRYMHYFERYKQHLDSLKKEKDNRAKLLGRINSSVVEGTECRDFGWLIKALDQLSTARQVLSNSYAFAYFFFGGQLYADEFDADQNGVNQNLFEDAQEQLAQEVERLSGLVEKAKGLSLDAGLRLEAINSSVNIQSRIVKFFELVEADLYGKLTSSSAQIAVSYRA